MVGAESVIAPSQRNPVPVRDNTVFTVSAGVRVTPRTRGVFAVLSPHLEGMVRMRDSLIGHTVSPLALMVLYMYVTGITTEFRYFRVNF